MLTILKEFNIIIRKYAFALLLMAFACTDDKKQKLPENAINPEVINNPATASEGEVKDNVPVLEFEKDHHDFGTITEGEKLSYAFKFKNVGKGDLVIRAAQASCGCTVSEYPKDAIKPGEGGTINVTFDSAGKTGQQTKSIDVISNTVPNVYKLNVSCTIIPSNQ